MTATADLAGTQDSAELFGRSLTSCTAHPFPDNSTIRPREPSVRLARVHRGRDSACGRPAGLLPVHRELPEGWPQHLRRERQELSSCCSIPEGVGQPHLPIRRQPGAQVASMSSARPTPLPRCSARSGRSIPIDRWATSWSGRLAEGPRLTSRPSRSPARSVTRPNVDDGTSPSPSALDAVAAGHGRTTDACISERASARSRHC